MEIKTGIYKHFKGGTVLVYGTETFSEDKSTLVKYIGLQNNELYARPADDFCGFKETEDGGLLHEGSREFQRGETSCVSQNVCVRCAWPWRPS